MKNNTVVFLIIGAIILGALFFLFKPQQTPIPQNTSQDNTQVVSPSAAVTEKIKTFEVEIQDKKVKAGSETMTVAKGDEVIFKITADRDGEFHLHGYDDELILTKGVSGELKITANLTGRFGVEFHESEDNKYEVAALEVLPE